jgi:plasmid maintenance system antidote protein VapI
MLPAFSSFLKINVDKEIEKDRQIILRARSLQLEDRAPVAKDTEDLISDFREIDKKFLRDISSLASSIVIHYDDIERYRRRRITMTLDMAYRILRQWDRSSGFRTAVTSLYSTSEFNSEMRAIFDLYINETRMLSESVKIPGKLRFARDALISRVGSVMDTVAAELTQEISRRMFINTDRRTSG